MATITGYTKELMDDINDSTIVDGVVNGSGNLILERRDGATIDAGSVIGPTGPMGSMDPGDLVTSIRTTKTGYLLMGTSHPGADVAYPALWAVVPATWKSGTTLNLPSMTDKIAQGGGTLGASTGANTKVLVEANLPPHTHTGPSHTHTGPNHTHAIDHDHATFTSGAAGSHGHQGYNVGYTAPAAGGTWFVRRATDGAHNATVTGTEPDHTHDINVPAFVGASGNGGTGATGASGTGATGVGSGTSSPVDVQQSALRVNWFIKT